MRKVLKLISVLVAVVMMLTMVSASAFTVGDVDSDANASSYLFSEEVWELINSASDGSAVEFDIETGEVSVIDSSDFNSDITETPSSSGGEVVSPTEIVGGSDERTQITNTSVYPYCAIVYIETEFSNGSTGAATGVFIDDTTILTAGHVVYRWKDGEAIGFATSVTVYPGGKSSSLGSSEKTKLVTTSGWVNSANSNYDYGIIKISSSMGTGYYSMKALSDSELEGLNIYCTGYPGDKDEATLWRGKGTVGSYTSYKIYHSADTKNGMSGSPIVATTNVTQIVAIHTTAYDDDYNGAVRITSSVISLAEKYMD